MESSITVSDWAIIFATLVGPVLAVQAQKYLEHRREVRQRRYEVFATLMRTRTALLSQAHVDALNAVPVEFYAVRPIRTAFKVYHDHLNTPAETDAWGTRRIDLLIALIQAIGTHLGLEFDAVEVSRGYYSPTAHATLQSEQDEIRRGLLDLLSGSRPLPLDVRRIAQDGAEAARLQAVHQSLLDWLEGRTTPTVSVMPSQPQSPSSPPEKGLIAQAAAGKGFSDILRG